MTDCVKCGINCSYKLWQVGNKVILCPGCHDNHIIISKDVSCDDYKEWCAKTYFEGVDE